MEALRALKRRLSDVVYRQLFADARPRPKAARDTRCPDHRASGDRPTGGRRVWDLGDGFTMMIGPNAAAIILEVG